MRRSFVAAAVMAAGFLAADTSGAGVALYKAPGSMRDIDAGPGGQIYGIGALDYARGNGFVYKWQDRNWIPFSGHGVRIAVDNDGDPWIVNISGQVWRFHDGAWECVAASAGAAQDIAAGGDEIFIIGTDGPGTNGTVSRWNGTSFVRFGGYGTRITVDRDGHPWIVNAARGIWHHDGSWRAIPGSARSIDAGADGTVYMIGAAPVGPPDGGIFRRTGDRWEENGGYGVDVAVLPDGNPAIVNSASSVWATFYRELPLQDFGYDGLRTGERRRRAMGARPTLVILREFSDSVFGGIHTPTYYEDLFFGGATADSVDQVFRENSRLSFAIWNAGVVPISDPRTFVCAHRREPCPGDGSSYLNSYAEALRLPGMEEVNFSLWDDNDDGRITDDELFVVFVSAYNDLLFSTGGHHYNFPGGCATTLTPGMSLCAQFVVVGDGTNVATIVHEMLHNLGADDIYGARVRNNVNMSLMAGTIVRAEDFQFFFHLDPWHKMRLGWVQPLIVPIAPGTKEIRHRLEVPQLPDSTARPLLLYDPNRGPNEYFLVEFRNSQAEGGSFDRDVAADGVVVWLVQRTSSGSLKSVRSLIEAGLDGLLQSIPVSDDRVWTDGTAIDGGANRVLTSTVAPGSDDVYGFDKVNLVVSPTDQQLGGAKAFNSSHGRVNLRWMDWARSWVEVSAGAFEPASSSVEVILTFRHNG